MIVSKSVKLLNLSSRYLSRSTIIINNSKSLNPLLNQTFRSFSTQTPKENKDENNNISKDESNIDLKSIKEEPKDINSTIVDNTKNNTNEENNNNNNNSNEQTKEKEKEKTFAQKLYSKLKWGTITSVIVGTIGFLFYESHLRTTLPYRLTLAAVENNKDIKIKFGGSIAPNKWYQCFSRPITGYVTNKEGGMNSIATLSIPIIRPKKVVPTPDNKEVKQQEEEIDSLLPEDQEILGMDGGAQTGYIYVKMNKKSANWFDWQFETLTVQVDDGTIFNVVEKKLEIPKSRRDVLD